MAIEKAAVKRTCYFEQGQESKVAVVLSCPGSKEEENDRPASGTTGENLELLLSALRQTLGRNDLTRKNITITNSSSGIEYRARTGRTEANSDEIMNQCNIDRLNNELADISDFVLFCGDNAKRISQKICLRKGTRSVYILHLGMQGLNHIKFDPDENPIMKATGNRKSKKEISRKNILRRIEVLVQCILKQLEIKNP
jgi:hypothetical protein